MANGIDLVVDEAKMESMSTVFRNGAQQLEDVASALGDIASELENGALLGKAGDEYGEVLRNNAQKAVSELSAKFDELAADIDNAVERWRDATAKNKSLFGG
jgi:uncharacterized protein YukE